MLMEILKCWFKIKTDIYFKVNSAFQFGFAREGLTRRKEKEQWECKTRWSGKGKGRVICPHWHDE